MGSRRSCAKSRETKSKNSSKQTIIIITITICRATVVYDKTPLAPLRCGAGAAAAVEGTVWSPHPKAGLFSSCVSCVQGRLIEWLLAKPCKLSWADIGRRLLRDRRRPLRCCSRHPSKKEMKAELLRSGLHPPPRTYGWGKHGA